MPHGFRLATIILAGGALCGACNRSKPAPATAETGSQAATGIDAIPAGQEFTPGNHGAKYPAPRWPSYFKPPKTVDDLMPAARALVSNQSGLQGKGLGILQPGESVLIVAPDQSDPMVLDAVKRALSERKVTAYIKYGYELLGETKAQADKEREEKFHDKLANVKEAGIYQASDWITGQFPDPSKPKAWLKDKDPDTYYKLFPEEANKSASNAPMSDAVHTSYQSGNDAQPIPSAQGGRGRGRGAAGGEEGIVESQSVADGNRMGEAIKNWLKAHPQARGVFWGGGGSTSLRRYVHPMEDKFLGLFTQGNIYDLESRMSSYPGDVWQLAEEQLLEPLTYVDRVEARDPEGTNVWADITSEMAQRWAAGAYQRGHLYMFPNQATGRFGYSFTNYPAFQAQWLPREPLARINGVIAGTQGHGGFFPRWEVFYTNGFVSDVKGGGAQGAALKDFLSYPPTRDLQLPYHNEPGYFYLYEIAFGTHPKGFRHPLVLDQTGATTPERVRDGVIHWGLGARMIHDPSGPTESETWAKFTTKNDTPVDHGWHTHTYFTTYKVRLRGANKWVTLLDKGHMTSLDNPEVRALASRYGDPNYMLTEDWVPEVPGINAPGDYLKDYAQAPGDYAFKVIDEAVKGTYQHYFPGAGTQITFGGPTPQTAAKELKKDDKK